MAVTSGVPVSYTHLYLIVRCSGQLAVEESHSLGAGNGYFGAEVVAAGAVGDLIGYSPGPVSYTHLLAGIPSPCPAHAADSAQWIDQAALLLEAGVVPAI